MKQKVTSSRTDITLTGSAGGFVMHIWHPPKKTGDSVLVLPNGYGLLEYARTVCEELSSHGHNVYSIEARGQGRSDGEYSINGAAEDICDTLDRIHEQEKDLHLLAHCSSALPLIYLGKNAPIWKAIKSVTIYCYLAEPHTHMDIFRHKCQRYGVRLAKSVGRLDCYGPEAYRSIPVPLTIVHPKMPTNLRRASLSQLHDIASKVDSLRIATPATGYNINAHAQKATVRTVIERDLLPLVTSTNHESFDRESLCR
jgi:hypothetical protein